MTYYVLLILMMQTYLGGSDASFIIAEGTFFTLDECNRQVKWLNNNPDKPDNEVYECVEVYFEVD